MRFDTPTGMLLIGLAAFGLFSMLGAFGIIGGYTQLAGKTVSAQNLEQNYEWFKSQESSMKQLESQICSAVQDINEFKTTYGTNASLWTKTTKDDYSELSFVKSGYVSKYNALASDYNARRASFIRSFGRDPEVPRDYAQFYDAQCS